MRVRLLMGSLMVFALAGSPRPGAADGPKPAKGAPASKAAPAKPAPKPVKSESRAELEAEVEQLRAENAKLRADLDQMRAREDERTKRMQSAIGSPSTTLK